MHTYIENELMYPRVREALPEVEDDVLESTRSTTWPTCSSWSSPQ